MRILTATVFQVPELVCCGSPGAEGANLKIEGSGREGQRVMSGKEDLASPLESHLFLFLCWFYCVYVCMDE